MTVLLWYCCPIFVVRSIPETSVNIPSFITTKFPRLSSPALVLGLPPLLHVVFSFSLLFWGLGLTSLLFTFLIFFFLFFHAIFLFILFAHLTFFHFFSRRLIFFCFKKKKKKISGSTYLHPLSCGSSCIFPLFSLSFICASFIILDLGDRVLGRENKACCARFSTVVF